MDDNNELLRPPVKPHSISVKELPAAEFYAKPDSCYIRVQYVDEIDSFKFEVKNEIFENHNGIDELPQSVMALSAFIRGMLEFALAYPHDMYRTGVAAQNADMIKNSLSDLPPDQRALLLGKPVGEA